MEVGVDEEFAFADGGSAGEDDGGVFGVAECPLEFDGGVEFFGEEGVEAAAAEGGVFDFGDFAFEDGVGVVGGAEAVGSVLGEGGGDS